MEQQVTNEFEDQLAKLEGMYADTKPQSEDFIPEGTYQLRIEKAELKPIPQKELIAIIMQYSIPEGELKGKTCTTWDRLNNENGIKFWKEKLKRLGFDPEIPLAALETDVLPEMPGMLITASVKNTKGKGDMLFTNVYVQSVDGKDESTS
jgi:hypothetical protein